jgi:Fe-S-cluster-containing dehydrogenase component
MKSTDVVAWVDVANQEIYCANCSPSNEFAPIFADTETDSPTHCTVCDELIDQNYTDACIEYMTNRMAAWLVRGEGKKEIIEMWAYKVDELYLGPVEQTVVDLTKQRVKYLDDQLKPTT